MKKPIDIEGAGELLKQRFTDWMNERMNIWVTEWVDQLMEWGVFFYLWIPENEIRSFGAFYDEMSMFFHSHHLN